MKPNEIDPQYVTTNEERPRMYKAHDVGLIVVSTVGLALMVLIAIAISIMASSPTP